MDSSPTAKSAAERQMMAKRRVSVFVISVWFLENCIILEHAFTDAWLNCV
jgi:hypothetical protein